MATDTATSTRSARIVDTGKRKFIPGLEITHSDGRTEVSKGNRAVKAQYVAFRFHVDTPDDVWATTHARLDLAQNYIPGSGRQEHAHQWGLVEIVEVEPYAEDTDEEEAPEVDEDQDLAKAKADAETQRARLVEFFRGLGDEEGYEPPAVLAISTKAWFAAGKESIDPVERYMSYARRVSNILAQLRP